MKSAIKYVVDLIGYKISKKYTFPELDFFPLLKNYINKDESLILFDVGANEGRTALKLTSYFPNATIYSFEPVEKTYRILNDTVAKKKNIKTFHLGMGEKEEQKEIFLHYHSEQNSLLADFKNNFGSEMINLTTIDTFIEKHNIGNINILKTDTEGFEFEVIKGAHKTLENQRVDFVYVEVGFDRKDRRHVYFYDMITTMKTYKYSFIGLFEQEYYNLELGYANALFVSEKVFAENSYSNTKH